MAASMLTEDEFRLLAYVRAYADRREQHLAPHWVQEQLEFTEAQLRQAARGLAAKGLAEFFEWEPSVECLAEHPEITAGLRSCDIVLTEEGWDYLRRDLGA